MNLVILLPTIIQRSIGLIVPRTIALVFVGFLYGEFLSSAQGSSSVTLAWNPSPSSGVAGYYLYYGTSSGSYPQFINIGNTTSGTVSNLAAGQTYFFVVTAYNTAGLQSVPSNQVSYTTAPATLSVASAPPGPTVVNTIPNTPDFDGNGDQDLLWRNKLTGEVGVWLMNGATRKAAETIGAASLSWVIINSADFDGDGKSDILWQFANTTLYGVWLMDGTEVKTTHKFTLPSYAGQICCVADLDGDHLADLVSFNRSAGSVYFWKNNGSFQFALQTSYAVSAASGWLPVGIARLNGASAPPALIWRNANTGSVAAWFMSSFSRSSVLTFGNPGTSVALRGFGDFSGDGKADLLLFNTSNHVVGYWRLNGAQPPNSISLAQVAPTWVPVGVENLNGSGDSEIIWRETATGALGAWQVSGSIFSGYLGSLLVGSDWHLELEAVAP
jgi:Fibronectin type III domain/FG-GAP-like repeat